MSLNKKIGFKLLSGIVLLTMFLSILSPILFYPEPAQAQFSDVAHIAMQIGKKVWEGLRYIATEAWRVGGAVAYKNALNVYLGQMAQQSAEYIASGGKGQKPLFLTDPQYWKKAGDEALGEFIDKTAQASGFINQSLCDPLDPQLKFKLLISIPDIYFKLPAVPQNKLCSLSKIKKAQSDTLKKTLVSFSADTEAGGEFGAKLEQLNQLFRADTTINDNTRNALGCFKGEINNSFTKITGYLSEIDQKWPDVAAITNEGLLDKLKTENKNLFSLTSFEEGKGEECFTSRDLVYPISTCSSASVNDFCNNQKCRNYCKDFESGKTCAEQYASKCKPPTQKAYIYHQQLFAQIIEIVSRTDKFIAGVESQDYAGGGPTQTLEDLQKDMSGSGSDLGALMALSDQAKLEKEAEEKEKSLWGLMNKGMKPVEGLISGKTLTPSFLIDEQGRKAIQDGTASVKQYTGAAVADAIGIFTGTLASKLLERLKKGLNPAEDPGTSWSFDPSGKVVFNPGATEARVVMADLATVSIKSGGQVNLLDNYSSFIDKADYVMPDTNVIDAGFRRAIEEKMSISEAMEKNLLNKNWTVGEIGKADGFNDCNERFSLTNIKKLRRARIVPLGLDIAATKIINRDRELGNKNYTLKEVVDGFNQEASPFYHLVDPNWVLSIPQFFCEARGYGAVPIGGSNQRQEICVDMQDCLKTDEKGQCLGWGYCTREKNIWRFGGDECSKQYESCSIYKNTATNQEKSFVKNTINFSNCDQNNAGCKWYCKNYDTVVVDGEDIKTWTCEEPKMIPQTLICDLGEPCKLPCIPDPKKICSYPTNGGCICSIPGITKTCEISYGGGSTCLITTTIPQEQKSNAIYFNKNISTCSNDNEGCHEYIQATVNSGTNLIPNGSFESYNIDPVTSNLTTVNGWDIDNGGDPTKSLFIVDQTRAYSGKVVAKISVAWGNPYINAGAFNVSAPNSLPLPLVAGQKYTFSVWVNPVPVTSTTLHLFANPANGGDAINITSQEINPGWQRLVYTFDYPLVKGGAQLNVRTLRWEPGDATVVYFDDFQLEPGANTTPYKEYASINKIYLKSAPDYLKCGAPEEDPIKCANFTKKCNANQVGCELYTSVSSNSVFPAIIKNEDKCPSVCVGYNTFRQSATNFEPAEPFINFIPATGKTCPISDAGCEEFTNLDEVAKGGEGKEYYSYLRVCRKSDTTCGYFYTWVGSDTTGYQLKKYQLQVDSTGNAPAEVFAQTIAEEKWGLCRTQNDAITNPRCKEFYDAQGAISYRLYENTVSCSDDCHPLRKTKPVEAGYCPNMVADVAIPGAVYDSVSGICTYMAIPSEGVSCGKANVGCREYKGNNANNMKTLFNDQFETADNSFSLWSGSTELSGESINLGGHSMKVKSGNSVSRLVETIIKKDKSYLLTFWVKGIGTYSAKFGDNPSFGSKPIAGNEWQEIKLGPVNLSEIINLPESLTISGPTTFYLDNIVLKEITSNIYLIKDFWKTKTPAVCDLDYNNNSAPGFMVGCDSYKDRAGKFSYLKSFSSLCSDDKVGCDIVIDTHNSSSPFSQEFNKISGDMQNPDYANIPVDNVNYLVIDPKKTCKTEFKGCQRFGLPALDMSGAVVGWSDQYLKNDPDLYDRRPILCDQKGEGCEEFFEASSKSKAYFHDPKDRLCEYRANVNLASEIKSGWFQKGTNQACYYNTEAGPNQGKPYQPDGLTYGIYWAGESNYDNLVGICPSNQNGCTSFVDTQATATLNLVKNGNFEDGLTLTPPWYDVTQYNFVNSVTVGIAKEGENKLLSIDSNGASFKPTAPLRVSWFAAAVTQKIEPSISLPGSNYVIKAKVKVDNLMTPIKIAGSSANPKKSIAHLSVDLNFEGISGVPSLSTDPTAFTTGEWRDWAACYEWNVIESKWKGVDTNNNSILDCIDRLPAPNDVLPCSYDPATLTNSSVPLARCLLSLSAGFDVMNNANGWAWNITHGYWTNASIFIIRQDDSIPNGADGKWHDFSQTITAAGPLNPRSLKIKEASVNFRIIDQSYTPDTMGIGKASLDDVEIKALEPYYYINNTKLDRTSCNGQVSSKAGCVLFADSSLKDYHSGAMPFTYNSIATYKKSEDKNYNLVTPVDCTKQNTDDYIKYCVLYSQATNDTNAIIKVVRDRECGEWLTCAGSTSQWSKMESRFKNVCDYVMRCDQLSDNASISCASPVVTDNPKVLNDSVYADRDVSWSGMDYSGYSLYNYYPVEYLAPRQVSTATPDLYTYELRYKDGVKGVDGVPIPSPEQPSPLKNSIKKTCSLYPEIDSPFIPGLSDKYPEINVCQEHGDKTPNAQNDLYQDCQCAYAKGDYSGTMKYLNYSSPFWLGISSDESQVKYEPCPVGDPSGCIPLSKKKTAIGQRGYCLEQDLSVPGELNSCLTWWPGGAATGDPDIYNQYTSAGYTLESQPDQTYCVNTMGPQTYSISGSACVNNSGWQVYTYLSPLLIYKNEISNISLYLGADDNAGECTEGETSIDSRGWVYLQAGISGQEWYGCIENDSDYCYKFTDGDPSGCGAQNVAYKMAYYNTCTLKDGGAGTRAAAYFNADDSLNHVRVVHQDASDGDASHLHRDITIHTVDGCQYVMKPSRDTGTLIAKAWTDRLWNVGIGSYSASAAAPTSVNRTRPCQPFGRAENANVSRLYKALINTSAISCNLNEVSVIHNINSLNNLFVQYKEVKQISSTDLIYTLPATSPFDMDIRDTLSGTSAPKVASVQCAGGEIGGSCKLKEINKITINDRDTGDLASTGKIYPATLKFYAWADKNHMPIREVRVDWGDGPEKMSGNSSMLAKNHKPMCCTSSTNCGNLNTGAHNAVVGETQSVVCDVFDYNYRYQSPPVTGPWINTCPLISSTVDLPLLNFGNVPAACAPNYFQFNHLYVCSGAGSPGWNTTNEHCEFRPKVYVKDNWGWCNGSGNTYASNNSCVDPDGVLSTPVPSNFGASFSGSIFLKP